MELRIGDRLIDETGEYAMKQYDSYR